VSRYILERLTSSHPVAGFACGEHSIDGFLHQQALAEQESGWSATTVAVDPSLASRPLVGFYTLSPLTLRLDANVLSALRLTAAYPVVGGYLLGRLGVAQSAQGGGLGGLLVERAIATALRARSETGGVFLAVDAKDDRLVQWYLRLGYGFVELSPGRRRLALVLPNDW
jgi:GNAT superfamily N-acetyltransferase